MSKPEHVHTPGLLQPLLIPVEAWSSIGIYFITGLPKSDGKEVIMVVVDRLMKFAHFIALSHPYSATTVAHFFIDHICCLHGLPSSIVSDRDPVFTSKFWKVLISIIGIRLNLSTTYHPQTDGQTERGNQCLETYLRSMILVLELIIINYNMYELICNEYILYNGLSNYTHNEVIKLCIGFIIYHEKWVL
jgi:hypothetical protein